MIDFHAWILQFERHEIEQMIPFEIEGDEHFHMVEPTLWVAPGQAKRGTHVPPTVPVYETGAFANLAVPRRVSQPR